MVRFHLNPHTHTLSISTTGLLQQPTLCHSLLPGICSGMPQGKPNTQPQHIVATSPCPMGLGKTWPGKVEVEDVVKIKAHYTF